MKNDKWVYPVNPENMDTGEPTPATRIRKSKLQAEIGLITKYWSEGKSLQFIVDRLRTKSISCHRSTIHRFLKKILSL